MAFAEKIEEIRKAVSNSPQVLVLSAPIDPEQLNRQMQFASPILAGVIRIPNYRLTYLVPAGQVKEISLPLPAGFYGTRRSPLHFESDYYHEDLLVDVYSDGARVNPFSMPLTAPFDVDFGDHYLKRSRVDIVLTNNTASDAKVSFQVTPHIISVEMYEAWYRPIIEASHRMLSAVAGGRIPAIPR